MDGKKILVVGYYGDGNTGDEAILTSMLRGLRAGRDGLAFTVPAYGPNAADLAKAHGVTSFHFQDMARMLDAVESADLVIVGGGGLLHDLWPPEPEKMLTSEHWGLNYYCGIPWLAAGLGKPVMLYAVGAGPLLFPEGRDLVRDLARAARTITVRDEASARLLADLASDVPPPELTADPVWLLNPLKGQARADFLERSGIPAGPWLGVSVRNWNIGVDQARWEHELVAGLDAFARPRGLGVLFLPFQYATTPLQDDVGLSRRLAARLSGLPTQVLDRVSTPEEIGGAIAGCELLLGMRLHSVLFACMSGTPAVALDYDPKVAQHAALLDPPLPSIRLAEMTGAGLAEALEGAWETREDLAGRQKALARRLRNRAARNGEVALDLLERSPASKPREEALRTAAAIRRIEALKPAGVAVGARPDGASRVSPRPTRRRVRIVVSTFFDPDGNNMAYGGAERYLIELSRLVRGLGYEIEVFQRAASKPWVRYYRETRITGVVPKGDPFLLDSAIREVSPAEPELTIYLAFYLAQEAPPESIGISHCVYWDDPYYQSDPEALKAHTGRALASIEKLGTLVSVDTNTINWVRATRGALAEKCVYIPNFVDLDVFRPRPRPAGSPLTALFPCRLQPPKGFWLAAEVLPELLQRHPRLRFHFVGKAGAREETAVRDLVERYPGRVEWSFLPPERMGEAYEAADIVLLPTVAAEGTSLSCLEAQACGKAVVATHVGGLADLILSEHNGLLIEPNAPALFGAVERLIFDPNLRERLGGNASSTAWDFRIERWRDRWQSLLRTHLRARSEGAVTRAGRAPVTALFPATLGPDAGLSERLWPLAIEVARHGIDTYWVEGEGTRDSPHPRLHVLSEKDDLYLLRPLVFVRGEEQLPAPANDEKADVLLVTSQERAPEWWSRLPGERVREVGRLSMSPGRGGKEEPARAVDESLVFAPDASEAWRKAVRPALRRILKERRGEAARRPEAPPERGRAVRPRKSGKDRRPDEGWRLARQTELESAMARMRRDLAEERPQWRLRLAQGEERLLALQIELEKAQAYVREIQAEREGTVAALNLRLAETARDRAALRQESETAAAAWTSRLAAVERETAALTRERNAAVAGINDLRAATDRELALLRQKVTEGEGAIAALGERLAASNEAAKALEEERDRKAAAVAATRRQLDAVRQELQRVVEESLERHRHLGFAMEEIDRLRNTRGARIGRSVQRAVRTVRQPKELFFRLSAPGTPLYEFGLRVTPGPVARWLRRALAPHPKPENGKPAAAPRPVPAPLEGLLPPARGRYDAIFLSIIDWDFRFQRPQQIATQFARDGHRVLFLSTTKFRVGEGVTSRLFPKADGVFEVHIASRRDLDVYGGRLEIEDLETLEQSFESLAGELGIGDAVCFVQIPFWWPLAKRLRQRFGWRVVYDCMDEWTNFPGFGKRVLALEEDLVQGADVTIVSADRLEEKWSGRAKHLVLARNGVDLQHYRDLFGENTLLGDVARPVIGYYGALASWVDVPLIEKVARRYPKATIVLAGGHFDVDLSPVMALPNVRLLGQRPYDEMPRLLWNFDVCIIPFLVNDITQATNPVKFYEYLYGEKPVVAPELSELKPFAGVSYLARGREEFLSQLDRALAEPADDPRRPERRRIAEANDWNVRYRAIDDAVREAYPLVSVVVVTYGGLALTQACLDSLFQAETWPNLEVLVVDNGSADGTPEYLRSIADPRARCFFNPDNLGFAAANNVGIRAARGEIVVLLNNDTVVPPGLMGRLVAHLERDSSIGLLCPTTNFCGNEAKIEPGYKDIADLPSFAVRRAREFEGQSFEIAVAAMYCVAARAEVLRKVGPLDEAFGVGLFEDDDFSHRMREAGYRVVCAQDAYVHHVGQGSFRLLSPEEYAAIWKRNQAYFESKWGKSWQPHKVRAGVAAPQSRLGGS